MPAYNFHERFADAVEAGTKRQTVRATRKNAPRVGQTAYLFTGMRSKACRRLGEHTITRVDAIMIEADGRISLTAFPGGTAMRRLSPDAADAFARADGLAAAAELVDWIRTHHGLPFEGDVTYW